MKQRENRKEETKRGGKKEGDEPMTKRGDQTKQRDQCHYSFESSLTGRKPHPASHLDFPIYPPLDADQPFVVLCTYVGETRV
jgi:hypothetical protein